MSLRHKLFNLALACCLCSITFVSAIVAFPAAPALAATNNPPVAPVSIIAFPQRDFVSAEGYTEGDEVVVKVIHSATYGGGTISTDPANPIIVGADGLVEVNHPGGACWFTNTPDIRPGDVVQIDIVGGPRAGRSDATTVANVVSQRPVQTGPNTVQIHGTAQDAAGAPLPVDQLEQRLISPGNLFDFNNRRSLRANSAGNLDGSVAYDAPGSIDWTATYDNLLPDDVTRALEAESRIHWLGTDPAAGVEATIYEIGAAIVAGPSAPCTAPIEVLPPPPGSELEPPTVPGTPVADLNGTPNTVTITWDASTDNVGVTSYGVYRNGQPIANVQNPDASAPAPTSYVDRNVPPGSYSYTVDAADAIGNRSTQSAASNSVTTATQVATGIANEPPADGRAILAFPSRDFISAENYAADEVVDVQIIRNGIVVSSVSGAIPADGLVEVNHPGGVCWQGVTPELRAGDIVRTIAYGPESATIPRSIDQITVANVTANMAVEDPADSGTVVIHGTAQDASGNPIPVEQLEQRLVGASRDPFNANGRRALRADSAGAGDGTLSYDTENNPTGTKWTAVYTGLDQHDVDLATSVESRILWLGRDPLAGIEITLFEVGLLDPPGPSPAFCTSPLEDPDVTAPSAPNLSATPDGAAREVQLDWSAASDDWSVYGYLITRDGQPLRYVGATPRSFLDTNVPPGPHSYSVQAFDSASPRAGSGSIIERLQAGQGQRYGNVSAASNTVDVTMPDVSAPSVPDDLVATVSGADVTLSWSASTDDVAVTEYGVYRDGDLIATVDSTSYTDSGLAVGTYQYRVDAADAAGNRSNRSSPVNADVVPIVDTEAPATPTNVMASVPDVRARDIVISWAATTDNVGVAGYTVYRNGAAIATLNGSTLTYPDNSRPAGTYSYTVDAFDSAGNRSAQSAASVAAVANDPPLAPHAVIPFPARDFVSAEGYLGEGPVVISVLRGSLELFRSDPITPDNLTGLAEVNHPGGACWAAITPDIRPGDIIRVTNGAGVPDQTVVTGVNAERPIQTNPTTVVVHGVAVDEHGVRLPIDQIESRLVTSSANAFDKNGRRVLRADSAGSGDGTLVFDSATLPNWTATYTGLSAADVTRALGAESRGMWLGRAPLAGNESTIFENGPGTTGGPSAGFCDGGAGAISNAPAEPNRPQAGLPGSMAFPNTSAVPPATSAVRTVTLTNASAAAMRITKIYLAGANPGDFARTGGNCPTSFPATLNANTNCTVTLTFSPAAVGPRSANLSFMDDAANTSYQTVELTGTGTDAAAPSAPGVPNQALLVGANPSATSIPITVSWAASVTGTVTSYELQRSENNGAFTNIALAAPTATSAVVNLTPGRSYAFRVRACNTTNCSAYSTGTSRALAAVQESAKDVSYSGTWTNQVVVGAFGGAVRFAATNRDKAQFKFTASSVAFVSTLGPNRGRISISVDGGAAQVIDLYAASQQTARVVFSISGLAAGRSHQIVVQVLGNRNASSSANRADVDGFITLQ